MNLLFCFDMVSCFTFMSSILFQGKGSETGTDLSVLNCSKIKIDDLSARDHFQSFQSSQVYIVEDNSTLPWMNTAWTKAIPWFRWRWASGRSKGSAPAMAAKAVRKKEPRQPHFQRRLTKDEEIIQNMSHLHLLSSETQIGRLLSFAKACKGLP